MHKDLLNKVCQMLSSPYPLNTLRIYKGTVPTVDINYVYATANHNADAITPQITVSVAAYGSTLSFATTPATVNDSATGTATWFALYNS